MPEVVQLPSPVFDESTALQISGKKRKSTSVVRLFTYALKKYDYLKLF
jgi:hypothetical protein